MMRILLLSAAIALLHPVTTVLGQQWSGPMFSSPLTQSRWDLVVADSYGSGAGIFLGWRPVAQIPGVRIRFGIADGVGTGPIAERSGARYSQELALLGGVDFSAPIGGTPTDLVRAHWIAGLGVGRNGGTRVSAPLGISIGYAGTHLRPYLSPRLVFERESGFGTPALLAIDGVVDWGVDLATRFGTVRAALTTGSWEGLGVGLSF